MFGAPDSAQACVAGFLVAAGTAKLFSPYAVSPLFEGILLRLPGINRIEPARAIRFLAILELGAASTLILAGPLLATLASALTVVLFAAFTYASWNSFLRRLPCPCFGLHSNRPVPICALMTTSIGFLESVYVLVVRIAGHQQLVTSPESRFTVVLFAVGGLVLAIAAWAELRAAALDLNREAEAARALPNNEAAETSEDADLIAGGLSGRNFLTGGSVALAGALVLPKRLSDSSSRWLPSWLSKSSTLRSVGPVLGLVLFLVMAVRAIFMGDPGDAAPWLVASSGFVFAAVRARRR